MPDSNSPAPDPGLAIAAYDEGTPRSVLFGMLLLTIGTALAFLVVALSLIPFIKQWFARDVTLTVETETQSVAWRAQPTADEPLILPLPPGKVMQQKVGEDFSVSMIGTPLTVPAISADGEVELRMVSRGPCDFELTARAANDRKIAVFDGGAERPDLAASEVIYVLRDRSNPVELAAPCTDETARYDFLLNRAFALDVGEGVPAAEIPTKLVSSTPTILSGAVSAHNRAWLFDTRYDLGSNAINPGDFVRLAPESSRGSGYQLAISGAVSFAPAKGALDVVAYASSAQAEVEHFGGRYVFTATTWETIASQPVVQFFFSALAAMLAIVGFVMGIKKWRRQGLDGMDASIH
ncbi:MAG TPA: hypothetical protein VFV70_15020 [Hyphomonadaceae bacterium]|nr:hypothetical protein [Hyphomonadaceae bacterium]